MSRPSEPFWGWPGWPHLRLAAVLLLAGTLWFLLVYGGCDVITAHRRARVRIHLDWELNLPFIPEAVLFYMSIYLLFVAGPFILRQRRELLALAVALNVAVLAAGVGFLLVPARLGFRPQTDLGMFPGLFRLADRLNLTYNLVPSLHVALSVICIAAYAPRAGPTGKVLLWLWAVAIALSTVLTQQHHIVDILTGWALGLVVGKLVSEILRSSKSSEPRMDANGRQ